MVGAHLIYLVSLSGVVLDGLGGLYLAYDLFGAERGLLRFLTTCITYGVVFLAGYGLFLGGWFGLMGLVVSGPTLATEHWRHQSGQPEPAWEKAIYAACRATSLGIAGWLSLDRRFGGAFALLGTILLLGAYLIGGAAGEGVRVYSRPKLTHRVIFSGSSRGLALGLAAMLAATLLREQRAIALGIRVGIVIAIVSALAGTLGPSVEWWAQHLPPRRLGAYGAFLVLIGSILQTMQYLFPLLQSAAQ
jgi:hypothetical protein